KLNDPNGISIAPEYLDSKIDELHLAYEYSEKKQEEKDELREQREREREDKKAQKQIQDAQKKLNKELDHYKKALVELTAKLSTRKYHGWLCLYNFKYRLFWTRCSKNWRYKET